MEPPAEKSKLTGLIQETARILGWEEAPVRKAWETLALLPPATRENFNPMESDIGLDEEDTLGFFIASARTGLTLIRWSVACASCATIIENQESLHHFRKEDYQCPLCGSPAPVDLDTTVEVGFRPNPEFFMDSLDPYNGDRGVYEAHFLSRRYGRHPQVQEFLQQRRDNFSLLGLWEFGKINLTLSAGETLRVINLETQTAVTLSARPVTATAGGFLEKMKVHKETSGAQRPIQTLEADLKEEGFLQEELEVHSGRIELWAHNQTQKPAGLLAFRFAQDELRELTAAHPATSRNFLSGKRLITHQSFRDLLLDDNLPEDFRLSINRLTLLFTNIKDSVQIFRNLGDSPAHEHIQNHYSLVAAGLRKNHGALVKTMGDQTMAVFSRPQDGIKAAAEILEACREYSSRTGIAMDIRAALHEDRVLAVKANKTLDFFGTSVNKCAILLHHSEAGEIWTTTQFMDAAGVSKVTAQMGYNAVQEQKQLDGDAPEVVYACRAQKGN